MSWAILRSRIARADLSELWLGIASEDVSAADRWLDRIDVSIKRLERFPEIGRPRDDIAPGLRGRVSGKTLILYRLDELAHNILILRVIDGRRDLAKLFAERNASP